MKGEHDIQQRVLEAKGDMKKADGLIRDYLPFIRSRVSKFTGRVITGDEDENSVGMIAFHEAVRSYNRNKGSFLSYAALVINSRLTDWVRKEAKHYGHLSLYRETGENEAPLHTTIADNKDRHTENRNLTATKEELAELAETMAEFGLSFTDIAENSPKQERTLEACRKVVRYAVENKNILDKMLESKKLPIAALSKGTDVDKKTLERHRRYILAMLIIQTNGYEIIRGHIRHVIKGKGGVPV